MRKYGKHKRSQVPDRSATTDIMSQIECAIRYPHATAIGALIGGLVPWFARTLAHEEVPSVWAGNHGLALIMIAVVLGCAVFSALTVYKFGCATFGDARKAIGFTLALEGVMLVSHGVTSGVALFVLILINAMANGSVIALAREATCRRRAADARGAATRARSRAERIPVVTTPIPVETIEEPRSVPTRSTAYRAVGHALITKPRWTVMHDDVIDAEIVSEEMLPS